MVVTGKAKLVFNFAGTKPLALSTPVDAVLMSGAQSFTNGAGDDQVNQLWSDTRTLADAASEDLDLAGVLADAFGDTITFTYIKGIYIKNKSTDASLKVLASDAPLPLFAGGTVDEGIVLPAGGRMYVEAPNDGWAVTGGSADEIRLTHGGEGSSTLDYDIIIIGTV